MLGVVARIVRHFGYQLVVNPRNNRITFALGRAEAAHEHVAGDGLNTIMHDERPAIGTQDNKALPGTAVDDV